MTLALDHVQIAMPAGREADRYRRIEMRTRYGTERISHRQDGKPERERDTREADAESRKRRGQHRAAATTDDEPERAEEFRAEALADTHRDALPV